MRRWGFSVLEIVFAIAILAAAMIPLLTLVSTTNRGTKVTRDHLIAGNLAELAFEQVYQAATEDSQLAFDKALGTFNTPGGSTGPGGCPGVPISTLGTQLGETLMPSNGDPALDPATGDPDYVSLYQRYSYTMTTRASENASVTTTDSRPTLARVDIRVYWKDIAGNCQWVDLAGYIPRRRY
jgi:hypothetical protein